MENHLWFALLLLGMQQVACENCSSLSIRPKEETAIQTWTFDVEEIELNVTYNCTNPTNITMTWTEATNGESFPNGSLSITGAIATISGTTATFIDIKEIFTAVVLLKSNITDKESHFNVTYRGLESHFTILRNHCEPNTSLFNSSFVYGYSVSESCQMPTSCPISWMKTRKCGKFAKWESEDCKIEPYNFNFSQKELKVPVGENVTFRCNKAKMDVFKSGEMNSTVVTRKAKSEYHGTQVSCFDLDDTGNRTNNTNATVKILTLPTLTENQSKERFAFQGQEFSLKLTFLANPIVSRQNITIMHESETIDFFFRTTGDRSFEILTFFKKVQTKDFGKYSISIEGVNTSCSSEIVPIDVTLKENKELHHGWITTIVLGSLLLISFIAIIVVCFRWRSSRQKKDDIPLDPVRPNNVNTKVQHREQQQSPPPPPQPRRQQHQQQQQQQKQQQQQRYTNPGSSTLPPRQQNHVNINYQTASDDEFDTDEYEEMCGRTSPRADRPQMPLPPTPRGTAGRSPQHTPQMGYDSRPPEPVPHRGLPPPRVVGTLPGNRGYIPPMRNVPAPPPHSSRQPQSRGY